MVHQKGKKGRGIQPKLDKEGQSPTARGMTPKHLKGLKSLDKQYISNIKRPKNQIWKLKHKNTLKT